MTSLSREMSMRECREVQRLGTVIAIPDVFGQWLSDDTGMM